MRAVSALLLLAAAAAHCPNFCNGHGRCVGVNRCECFSKWGGGDCSLRLCAAAPSWNDVAIADETAHQSATCAGRGECDTKSGTCRCDQPFEGTACQRFKCPSDCHGHGKCRSMRTYSQYRDAGLATHAYTGNWDADAIHGCECDIGHNGSYDCSVRDCAFGDDPMTQGQADEVQIIRCDLAAASAQTFALRFRKETTAALGASTTASQLEAALEALSSVGDVSVTYKSASGSTATLCSSAATPSDNIVEIKFLTETGDVPSLLVVDGATGAALAGAAATSFHMAADGAALTRGTDSASILSVKGTKEWAECSNRGRCDGTTGVCMCYAGFLSSDRRGNAGTFGDCGYAAKPVTSCPGVGVECSGHGSCSGHPEYVCTCDKGWMGGDCGERTCPQGTAWFDLATASNKAHNPFECSNRGTCDRTAGRCVCQPGFNGEACQKVACPGTLSDGRTCSGHGACHTIEGLAAEAKTNGVASPFTYGSNRNAVGTWDFRSNTGCICHEGFEGHDCSLRSCPKGDNPTTSTQLDEVQTLTCAHVSGTPTFRLRFRGQLTAPIAHTATAADIKAALELVSTIGTVSVAFDAVATQACSSPGTTTITVSFHTENGDLPALEVVADGFTQGVDLSFPATLKATEATKGSTENSVCSNRGVCNHKTGNCECFLGYGSSDGSGGKGTIADCGYREPYSPLSIDEVGLEKRTKAALAWAQANNYNGY